MSRMKHILSLIPEEYQYLLSSKDVGTITVLEEIPDEERKYKCYTCSKVVEEIPCPNCGDESLEIMCPVDHTHCSHSVIEGVHYCPICGQGMCFECGSHDVMQLSRVTGYLQEVGGWNEGKKAELRDRQRVVLKGEVMELIGNKRKIDYDH